MSMKLTKQGSPKLEKMTVQKIRVFLELKLRTIYCTNTNVKRYRHSPVFVFNDICCGVSLLGVRTFFRNFCWQKVVVILVKRRQIKKLPNFLTYMGTLVICTKLQTSFDPLSQFWLYGPAVCIFLCFALHQFFCLWNLIFRAWQNFGAKGH
jgi:hypothetical protein